MKKILGEIMSDPRIWEMSEEEKQRGRQRIMEIAKREIKSGMLTYKDEEPVMVHAQRVEMMPSPRRGIVGWFKDRLFGVPKKPQAMMVLDRHSQELLKEYMKNPEPLNNAVAACAVSAEDIKEATDRVITLARGHHIRNADGTITDVSDNPKYKCKMNNESGQEDATL